MNSEQFFSEDESFHLRGALLVYARGNEAVATYNAVQHMPHTERPYIAPGVPASRNHLLEIAKDVANIKEPVDVSKIELFPSNLLYLSPTHMVWHVPSQKRRMYVKTDDKQFNADVNGKPVPHPALLFVAKVDGRGGLSRGGLYVFALPDDERPTPETPLYRAPYLNVYAAGHLCEGSYRLPEVTRPRDIPQWEGAFFETQFSHTNIDGRSLCAHKHGHHAMWRELARLEIIRENAKSRRVAGFPLQYLNRLAKPATVGEALGI